MKKTMKLMVSILLLTTMIFGQTIQIYADETSSSNLTEEEFRGVWVATVLNIDYPKKGTTNVEALKTEAITILDRAQANGLNAVILQVRPTGDAFYKSALFPWSKYLTGIQGTAPENNFDPLEFWIEEAHKRNLELHAWINPFRVTKKTKNEASHDYNSLSQSNPARLHPEWTVKYNDGNIYYDPGIPAARDLIVDGVAELISNYSIDGIHFDDYFYPGTDFDDASTFNQYGTGFSDVGDFRRHNVDLLIEDVHQTIKAIKPEVEFGISPFGIWANKKDNALGSDTKGLQSYYAHYADTKGWVEKEIIDYIAPQLYWNIGYTIADYEILAKWWNDVCKESSVKLYIGHGAYRTGNSDSKSAWYGVDEIRRQLDLNQTLDQVEGSIFYNNTAFINQPSLGTLLKTYYASNNATKNSTANAPTNAPTNAPIVIKPVTPVTNTFILSRPSDNIKTTASNYYLSGASNATLPLFLNDKEVADRTLNGYFGIYVTLKEGVNTFTFKQGSKSYTRTITKTSSSGSITPMSTYQISDSTTLPREKEMRMAGEKITLICKAPIGAEVKVAFNGQSYLMVPKVTQSPDGKVYATTYSYEYTFPALNQGVYEQDLGVPVYTMKFGSYKDEASAPENLVLISKNSIYTGVVVDTYIDLYKTPVSGNGVAANMVEGMTDQITGMSGNYVRLASGLWTSKSAVTISKANEPQIIKLTKMDYQSTDAFDRIVIETSGGGAGIAAYDGESVSLALSSIENKNALSLQNSIIETNFAEGKTNLKIETPSLKGYYMEKTAKGFDLILLRNKAKNESAVSSLPLANYTILLDPGHGGSDMGARGLLGDIFTEKTINLNTAFALKAKLESLGAIVKMTRESDVDMSLKERLAFSLKVKPDLFLSIHADSLEDTKDISKVFGFSVFYKDPVAKALSDTLLNQILFDLGRKDRGANMKNFYVTRGTWAPSVLIETGFVCNPVEYEWLMDQKSQSLLVDSLARGIVNYFGQTVQ
ncbi:N-acetylmuramoyl-L-alanine amidase [Fusibacter sp. 3D3]|uniref:N-acetylmuramoyl-L-alanine amidase n=1 Tax=Fusibacter sp. 3D3 TaxID=1048380 RepID=UPI000853871F|nr:N-acetylmuramoyl-L-alanine amidase [Fusibacter sp. 3D3]GAU77036.1 predicted glycoside hydrolase [Fusibacter sp. 3D3]